ncbi:MAG: DUF2203 domain-containing protein [Planctomyces sp.]|uniref:DUF2203 domain-containing protein n=1 Tax=Rubinisphaera brasiliensis (strain ATCC 49424 / DSM 5305 / JCM 21570 / IAM 15109 / NBRC 103401 / IFAM 1448) TaxID=756272 RepID=F0SP93_RUBBR|nr:DUF2203 domain-containing protein [Rubinisphaera brasiliensis]ADY62201.1 Protein of unknown function DUF2203 [Rubinisphaera brasiliensis DSM 5305]MBB02305.1 DUF2203 domain-containing protein [Planctomyces sp.]
MNATVPTPETSKRFFTPEEANKTLPLVRAIVGDIVSLYGEIRERRDRLADLTDRNSSHASEDDPYREEVEVMEASIYNDIERLQEFVSELTQLGIDLKDPEVGLIDFPGVSDGREVCLCWKLGEDSVDAWHEVDAGFAERQPLSALGETAEDL